MTSTLDMIEWFEHPTSMELIISFYGCERNDLKSKIDQMLRLGWLKMVHAPTNRYKATNLGQMIITRNKIDKKELKQKSISNLVYHNSRIIDCFDVISYVEENIMYLPEKLQNQLPHLIIYSHELNHVHDPSIIISIRHEDDDLLDHTVSWIISFPRVIGDSTSISTRVSVSFEREIFGWFMDEWCDMQLCTPSYVIICGHEMGCVAFICRKTLQINVVSISTLQLGWVCNTVYQHSDTFSFITFQNLDNDAATYYKGNIDNIILMGSTMETSHFVQKVIKRDNLMGEVLDIPYSVRHSLDGIAPTFSQYKFGLCLSTEAIEYDPCESSILQTDKIVIIQIERRRPNDNQEDDIKLHPHGGRWYSSWIVVIDKSSSKYIHQWNASDFHIKGSTFSSISAAIGPIDIISL